MSPAPRPYTLVAELTYACPLHCVYCSNPVDFTRHHDALETDDWRRVLREARPRLMSWLRFKKSNMRYFREPVARLAGDRCC